MVTDGNGRLPFHLSALQPGELLSTVVDRWRSLWELDLHLDRAGGPTGRLVLNFNDAGEEPGLAFCGDRPEHILIPDHDFFKSRDYAKARAHFDAHPQPWDGNERAGVTGCLCSDDLATATLMSMLSRN